MRRERSHPPDRTAASLRRDCRSVSDALAAAADGDHVFGSWELDHIGSCLRCRAEEARYRRLMEAMRSLRDAPVAEDPRLASQILGHVDLYGRRWARHPSPRVKARVGGLAAGAAAAAGLIAYTARHRRAARLVS